MAVTCPKYECETIISSSCVFYEGESLLYTGITTNMPIETALQTLDSFLQANNSGGGCDCPDPTPSNTVVDYRSSFEANNLNVYAGYVFNGVAKITKTINGNLKNAVNVVDLEADWANRLNLTYI